MSESLQKKLNRVRPPRVQITYDVETGGAIEKKELPFVVGVMADLAGKNAGAMAPLKNRKFVEIDRDNFNNVMGGLKPKLAFRVPNKLADDGTEMSVALEFRDMEDFDPASVIKQIEPLRKLYEARQRLNDLLAKLDGNDDLGELLSNIAGNTEKLSALRSAVGADKDGAGDATPEAPKE
jgi:type VI secretion system protein ImpB